jgi:radical SAM superfamily enzyme YgiQ (UPF0313 family)
MRKAGCKMIFLGAETGNDAVLKQMNKGGTQSGQMIKDFVLRMKNADIIPELSFVLGMPAKTEKRSVRPDFVGHQFHQRNQADQPQRRDHHLPF